MTRLLPIAGLAATLLLAACATPREACIAQARGSLRVLQELAAESRANLARGYALETRTDIRVVRGTCTGTNEDGSTFTFPCEETQTRDRRVPVPIDLTAEAAKLRSLDLRIAQEEALAADRIRTCIATHPE